MEWVIGGCWIAAGSNYSGSDRGSCTAFVSNSNADLLTQMNHSRTKTISR